VQQHLKLKSLGADGEISGYASVFNVTDRQGDVVLKGAFQNVIKKFVNGKKPKLLWQHDASSPIGIIEEIYEDDYGLFVKGQLLLEIPKAKEVYFLLKNKAIDGFSIGYKIKNRYFENNLKYITEVDLLEISVVTFPACESATIEEIKSIKEETNMTKTLPLSENLNRDSHLNSDFNDYIRKGRDDFLKKSLSDKDESCGGCFIPQEVALRIGEKLRLLSPIRAIARVMTISTNSVDLLAESQAADAGWVARNDDERVETDTPEVRKIKIPVHEVYAKPIISQRLLDDSQIDMEEWLTTKISEKFAILENWAFINGDGDSKPQGFLKVESEDKTRRSFGKLQHFYSGAAGKFADDDHAVDTLIDVVCSLKPIYAKRAKWIMSRSALSHIRKLRNHDGEYLWQPSLVEATPATLLGYPVIIDDDMPALEAGTESTAIAFGDFYAGYQIVDRQGLRILRDPYSSKPYVEFYATKRTGGGVVDYEAIKLLKFQEKT